MKPHFLIGCLLLISAALKSQTQSIIIDTALTGNYVVDIADTTVSSYSSLGCGSASYQMDLDHDQLPDFTFTLNCYMGGQGNNAYIYLSAADSCEFILDTMAVDSAGSLNGSGQIVYTPGTYDLVKRFDYGDTVYASDNFVNSTSVIVSKSVGNYPSYIEYLYLEEWVGQTKYIGIRKQIGGLMYYGWLKVKVPNTYSITIMEYSLNYFAVGTSELSSIGKSLKLAPNPACTHITILNNGLNATTTAEIFDLNGRLILKESIEGATLDVRPLVSGVYNLRLTNANGEILYNNRHVIVK